jgi:hypothetical protein
MAVQFWLGWKFSQIGRPLESAALGVTGAGFGLGMLGCLTFWLLEKRARVSPAVAILLAVGAVVLALAGLFWTLLAPAGALWLGGIAIAASLVLLVSHVVGTKRLEAKAFGTWVRAVLAICAVTVALSACAAFVPSALTLRFRWQDETQLNRLVRVVASRTAPVRCTSTYSPVKVPVFGEVTPQCPGSYAEFDANQQYQIGDYGFLFAPRLSLATAVANFPESCLLQLDGPWWELGPGGGGIGCPYGFAYIPGP